jgi:hypothetical protein
MTCCCSCKKIRSTLQRASKTDSQWQQQEKSRENKQGSGDRSACSARRKKIRTDGNCGPNMSGTRNLKTQRTAIGIVRRGSTRKRNHERKTAKKIQRGQKSRRQAGDRTNPGRQQPNRVLARAPREQNPTRGQHTAQKKQAIAPGGADGKSSKPKHRPSLVGTEPEKSSAKQKFTAGGNED